MNIRLHIDRLVLDGVPLEAGGAQGLQSALEGQLAQLLAEGGLSADLRRGGALRSIRAGNVQIPARPNGSQLGGQIARAVYEGIGKK